jgi:hypothetical protein
MLAYWPYLFSWNVLYGSAAFAVPVVLSMIWAKDVAPIRRKIAISVLVLFSLVVCGGLIKQEYDKDHEYAYLLLARDLALEPGQSSIRVIGHSISTPMGTTGKSDSA